MALGELHGRNLASALMRSRVHNRTSDRGGKPIQLAAVVVGIAPGPSLSPRDRGRSSLLLLSRLPRGAANLYTLRSTIEHRRGNHDVHESNHLRR
jgi:hypothetical protein